MAAMLPPRRRVLEFGARDVNGSCRPIFAGACHVGVDRLPGPGVDIVADAGTWKPSPDFQPFDTVVCLETLEHADNAAAVCANAFAILRPSGVAIFTAAALAREPHSAVDGGPLRDGEFYRNLSVPDLRDYLSAFGCVLIDDSVSGDIYALAVKT
jgi:SAM-dependent methyltransferase